MKSMITKMPMISNLGRQNKIRTKLTFKSGCNRSAVVMTKVNWNIITRVPCAITPLRFFDSLTVPVIIDSIP